MKTEKRPFEGEPRLPMRSKPNDSLSCDRVETTGCGAASAQLYHDHTSGPAAAAGGDLRGTVAQIDFSTGSVIRFLCCFAV